MDNEIVDSFIWKGKAIGVNKWKDASICFRKKGTTSGIVKGKQTALGTLISIMQIRKIVMAFMYLSKEYRAYKDSVTIAAKVLTPIDSYCDVTVRIFLKATMDSDGPIKGLMDALTASKAIKDDKYIRNFVVLRHYHANKIKNPTPDTIMVQLAPLSDEDLLYIEKEIKEDYSHL